MDTQSLLHPTLFDKFYVISAICFAVVLCMAYGAWYLWQEHARKREIRARLYAQTGSRGGPSSTLERWELKLLAPLLQTTLGERLSEVVEQSQTGLRPPRALSLMLLITFACALLGVLRGASAGGLFVGIALVSGLLVGSTLDAAWIFVLLNRGAKVRQRFTDQLPEVFQSLATSLRSGMTIEQSVSAINREMQDPAAAEFMIVADHLGKHIAFESAMQSLLKRQRSPDLEIGVNVILIQKQLGGDLSDMLVTLSNTIRTRRRAETDIRISTQQVRSTVGIVAALIPGIALLIALEDPTYFAPLFTPGLGIFLLFVAGACWLAGIVWTITLVRVNY